MHADRGRYVAQDKESTLSVEKPFKVVDLFSGAGGASFGFHVRPEFEVRAAVDVELGKPSTGHNATDCNGTYAANIGIKPHSIDLSSVTSRQLSDALAGSLNGEAPDVLIACPPCTGFSRTLAINHSVDDPRNSLVAKIADFASSLRPKVVVMENARELLTGKFRHHFDALRENLELDGYHVTAEVHRLNAYGLPQQRERAVVLAYRDGITPRSLKEAWSGWEIDPKATHVRRAIWDLPAIMSGEVDGFDSNHTATKSDGLTLARLQATPRNGGSWVDLIGHPDHGRLLTESMKRSVVQGTLNHFCDAYGRMYWDRPAPTIKRECAHVGNGRYAHPEQNRLCSVREMALLQGFPAGFKFTAKSRKNAYRAVGDAVPPLISYQLAGVVSWALTGVRPEQGQMVLPGSTLREDDLQLVGQ